MSTPTPIVIEGQQFPSPMRYLCADAAVGQALVGRQITFQRERVNDGRTTVLDVLSYYKEPGSRDMETSHGFLLLGLPNMTPTELLHEATTLLALVRDATLVSEHASALKPEQFKRILAFLQNVEDRQLDLFASLSPVLTDLSTISGTRIVSKKFVQ